jgi:hypothetical protein
MWGILGTLTSDLSRLVGAQSTQIWTLSVLIRIQPTSAQNGGYDARSEGRLVAERTRLSG